MEAMKLLEVLEVVLTVMGVLMMLTLGVHVAGFMMIFRRKHG